VPNPGGTNQFQGFPETIPYGDKARQGMLARLAPVAGDSAAAIGAPRRDQRATQRPGRGQAPIDAAPPMLAPLAQPAQLPPTQVFQAIASIPGASPTVQAVFGGGA
jgi:hypothetical protein